MDVQRVVPITKTCPCSRAYVPAEGYLKTVVPVAEISGGVEIIQRLGHEQVGVGIEAVSEFVALVAQIAFYFKFNSVSVLQLAAPHLAAELFAQPVFNQISDVPHHAGNLQAAPGHGLATGVVAFVEVGIGEDGLAGHVVKRDVLSGQFGRRGNHRHVTHTFGEVGCQLQGLYTAETAAP